MRSYTASAGPRPDRQRHPVSQDATAGQGDPVTAHMPRVGDLPPLDRLNGLSSPASTPTVPEQARAGSITSSQRTDRSQRPAASCVTVDDVAPTGSGRDQTQEFHLLLPGLKAEVSTEGL